MDIVYTRQEPRDPGLPAIFLAGPTSHPDRPVPSWRPQAVRLLEKVGFDGTVYFPEPAPGDRWPDRMAQVKWEHDGLRHSDCVLFWIPRDMQTLPAMTTNIEYGLTMHSGKVVVGAPRRAPHMRYIRNTAELYGIPIASSLRATVAAAVAQVEAVRGTDSRILARPVAWEGKHVRVELTKYRNRLGSVMRYETVRRIARGEIVAIVAVTDDRHVVLTKSFRVPHGHRLDYVIEFPAGLADKNGVDSAELARLELLEETGYAPGTPLTRLLAGPFDAGLTDDTLAYYFTSGARLVAGQSLEPAEDIEVLTVPLDEMEAFCLANQPHCDIKMLGPIAMARHLGLLLR